jgi:hypothetical protein
VQNGLMKLTNLKQLFLSATNISQSEIDELRQRLKDCEIYY